MLSGRTDEPAPPSARLRWIALMGAELSGEPVVNGCTVAVTSSDGRVHAFNARDGAPLWSHERAYAVPPEGVASALALDGDSLLAGLPVDSLLPRSILALLAIRTALESYAIDHNSYPPLPDLAAQLTPTYIRSLPPNPVTGAPMVESDTPSPGDYAESIRIHFTHDGRELNPLEAKAPDFEAQRRRSRFRLRLANGKVRWPCACRSAGSSSSPSRYR